MLARVKGVDLTPFISEKSYKMNVEEQYESWVDGNYKEHRIYTASKVKGSFTVCLYGYLEMTPTKFKQTWQSAVSDHVVTISVHCMNTNEWKTIQAYYTFDGTFHREMINGEYCDILTVNIKER